MVYWICLMCVLFVKGKRSVKSQMIFSTRLPSTAYQLNPSSLCLKLKGNCEICKNRDYGNHNIQVTASTWQSYISKHLLAGVRLHLREIEAHSIIQTVWVVCRRAALHGIIVLPWRCDIKWTSCTRPRGGALKILCDKKQSMKIRSLLCCIIHVSALLTLHITST